MLGSSRCSSTQSAFTSAVSRLMVFLSSARAVRAGWLVWFWCAGSAGRRARRAGAAGTPRSRGRSPKAALRKAAARANPVATEPSRSSPATYPASATTAKARPDGLGEPRRGGVLQLARRAEPGPDQRSGTARSTACAAAPRPAPTANTTACTASSATVAGDGASSSATASTTVVSVAANRGPRGSIWARGAADGPAVGVVRGHGISCDVGVGRGSGGPGRTLRTGATGRARWRVSRRV